jgi:hypothetical protein
LKKFENALIRRDEEKKIILELSVIPNPHVSYPANYTINFFRSQWMDQVWIALEQEETEEELEGNKNLAEFFENEEVLESCR